MEELYNKLVEAGDYTKSFEEFVEQYGDAEKSQKLYEGLSSEGGYTKSFEEFKSQYGFGEKKNQVDTPSSGQEEVTESITETPTEPGSLDSSQENVEQPVEVIEQPVEVIEQPVGSTIELTETDGVLTESTYTSSLLNDLIEKRNQAVEAERKREEQLSKTPSLYRSMQGSEAKDQNSLLEIDEVLREKILNDFNVKKALEFGFIHENLITNALKGDLEAISSLSDLAIKSPQEYREQIKDKKLNSKYGYANDSDISIEYSPEDRESGILNDRKKEAEDKVKSWNTETRKLLDAIPGGEGEATEEQLNNVFNREGAPTEEEFDLAEEEYVPTGFEKSDIHEMYDTQKLQKLGKDGEKFDVKEFDGYLKEQGYFQAYKNMIEEETIDETGESYSMYSSYNPTLAAERLKAQYLTNFINDRVEKKNRASNSKLSIRERG